MSYTRFLSGMRLCAILTPFIRHAYAVIRFLREIFHWWVCPGWLPDHDHRCLVGKVGIFAGKMLLLPLLLIYVPSAIINGTSTKRYRVNNNIIKHQPNTSHFRFHRVGFMHMLHVPFSRGASCRPGFVLVVHVQTHERRRGQMARVSV